MSVHKMFGTNQHSRTETQAFAAKYKLMPRWMKLENRCAEFKIIPVLLGFFVGAAAIAHGALVKLIFENAAGSMNPACTFCRFYCLFLLFKL